MKRSRIKFKCKHCGKVSERENWRAKGKFCDPQCYRQWYRARHRVVAPCTTCGKTVDKVVSLSSRTKRQGIIFCSNACFHVYNRGINHVRYKPDARPARGREWRKVSREVQMRDGHKCVKCGAIECDLPLHQYLIVDHVIPASLFNGDIELMNRRSNLKTLCMPEHAVKTTKYDPRILRGDMLAIGEFYGEQAKQDAIQLMKEMSNE